MDFVCPKRDVHYKENEFHIRHLGINLSRARPVTTDVFHCVRISLILIKVVLSKCRKIEISLKLLKIFFNKMTAQSLRLMSERHLMTVGHI